MPGPRYVKDFEFPSSFGFSRSASDSPTVSVRPHDRAKPRRFADGGAVSRRPMTLREKQMLREEYAYPKPKTKPKTKEEGKAYSSTDLIRGNLRRQREQDLGLKNGGKVRRAMGGPVKAAKGGDISQDRKMIKSALTAHIRAPKPRGHGVK